MIKKIQTKYKGLRAPAKASLWFLLCGFLQKGIGMLTTPVFTRVMTEVEYGEFASYNAWFSILQIIVSLNLAAGVYTRGLVKNEEDQHKFSSSMLGLSTTCILGCSVLYLIFADTINGFVGMTTSVMMMLLLDIWANAAYQFWSNRERVNYRYKKLVALTLAYVLLRPVLSLVAVLLVEPGIQMEARVAATVAVNVLLFSGLFFVIWKTGGQYFNKRYWSYALKFNLPLVPHYLSQVVLNQADRIMIRDICGAPEAAYYTVAYTLAMVLQILNNSVSATMNPWIYRTIKAGRVEEIGRVSYLVLAIIAVSNVAVIAIAPELMRILAPASYQDAVQVIPAVTVSVYFMFLYNLFATFEYYYEKTGYVMVASVVGAILNVVLNLIALPRFGFVAAGYTTLFCYILYAATHYYFMRRLTKTHLPNRKIYRIEVIFGLGGSVLLASAGMSAIYGYPVVRYGVLFVLVIAALVKWDKVFWLLKESRLIK